MALFQTRKAVSPEEILLPHFDVRFYLSQCSDLDASPIELVRHYLRRGAHEGRDPAPWFSTFGYLNAYPDVLTNDVNPFLHYIQNGRNEGRELPWLSQQGKASPPAYEPDRRLNSRDQMLRYLHWLHAGGEMSLSLDDILASGKAVIAQHIENGKVLLPNDGLALHLHIAAVRDDFDVEEYARTNSDDADSRTDLLTFYCNTGWRQFDNPRVGFDLWWYWRTHLNPDAEVIDPLLHYVLVGKAVGLSTHNPQVEDSLLSAGEMVQRDLIEPKRDDWWVFPVCAYDHHLSGNDRAVFEAVRHDPSIRKTILTRSRSVDLHGPNVHVIPLMSRKGQEALLRSRVIFIKHSPTVNVGFPLSGDHHLFIGLWHGIPFKRIGTASLDAQDRREEMLEEHAKLSCVISASPIDRLAMAAGFQPLSFDEIWLTGLPRHDLITCERVDLPNDMQCEEQAVRELLGGRRLVLFCPTFRNDEDAPGYRFAHNEVAQLADWLERNNAVLGIREHMADRSRSYVSQLKGDQFLPLPGTAFANIEVLYRVSYCLVTDYSSCFFDYMLTYKPCISFAYDLDHYQAQERGTFYDLRAVFPGPVCETFSELLAALECTAMRAMPNDDPQLALKRSFFLRYADANNANRVVERLRLLIASEN